MPEEAGAAFATLEIVALVLSLGLSAFFSSAETALTALSDAKKRQLMEKSPRRAKLLEFSIRYPNRVLTTVLIGNNVVNTFTAALATVVAERLYPNQGVSVAVGVTTLALLVIGEITPKTFAKHNAERLAPAAMYILVPLYYVMFFLVWPLTSFSKLLVRMFGGDVTRTGPFITEEDIAYYVQLGQKEGVLERHEEELISNVFDFADTVVKEVMVPRTDIEAIAASADLEEVLKRARESGHTRMPVYGKDIDDVRGFFHSRELLNVLPDAVAFVFEDNIKEALFVPELMKVSELLKLFQRKKTHLAIVVDEYGGTAGIVSLEDVIEEIVGEIRDEYDDEPEEIRRIDDDRYVALGKASIDEISEALAVTFPDNGTYETLGGFLTAQRGKMPVVGDRITFAEWLFVVTDADARRVFRCEIIRVNSVTTAPILSTRKPQVRLVK